MNSQEAAGDVLTLNGKNQCLTADNPSFTPKWVERPWIDRTSKQSPEREHGNPGGAADLCPRAETFALDTAASLRQLADALEKRNSTLEDHRRVQAFVVDFLAVLIRRQLKACAPGDWRTALQVMSDGSHSLDNHLSKIFVEHVNSPQFPGENRQIPPVTERLEFVQAMNRISQRLALQPVPSSSEVIPARSCLSLAGKHSALVISSREKPQSIAETAYLAGTSGRISLPTLQFSPRANSGKNSSNR